MELEELGEGRPVAVAEPLVEPVGSAGGAFMAGSTD